MVKFSKLMLCGNVFLLLESNHLRMGISGVFFMGKIFKMVSAVLEKQSLKLLGISILMSKPKKQERRNKLVSML